MKTTDLIKTFDRIKTDKIILEIDMLQIFDNETRLQLLTMELSRRYTALMGQYKKVVERNDILTELDWWMK